MKRLLHRLFILLALGVFLTSSARLLSYFYRYRSSTDVRQEAAAAFTKPAAASEEAPGTEAARGGDAAPDGSPVRAPIRVDFDRLRQVNPDVLGWIYCEGTVISYPVVFGRDNEYYLERDYRGQYNPSGSIFTDMRNENGFDDANVILYGHHMGDGTMFASLKEWLDQAYYEEHPEMWLMTPEQDYRLELFAGYRTTADSETYSIFREAGPELQAYLDWARSWSAIQSDVETGPEGHYLVLSTCAYSSEDARTVLHGKLVPVGSGSVKK